MKRIASVWMVLFVAAIMLAGCTSGGDDNVNPDGDVVDTDDAVDTDGDVEPVETDGDDVDDVDKTEDSEVDGDDVDDIDQTEETEVDGDDVDDVDQTEEVEVDGDDVDDVDQVETDGDVEAEIPVCDDDNDCTTDTWNADTEQCDFTAVVDGSACDDGDMCTENDTCTAGACVPGEAKTCDDQNSCTDDVCDSATGLCANPVLDDGTTCDDGDLCTTNDTCQNGACTAGEAVTCEASDQCHVAGVCDSATGECSDPNAPNGTVCDDGNATTGGDNCQNGVCMGLGCTCSTTDACCDGCQPINNGGACEDDGVSCTEDICDAGICGHVPVQGQCYIGGACIADGVTNPENACLYCDTVFSQSDWRNMVNGSACDDGDACTQTDTCFGGACTGSDPVACEAPDQCQEAGSCNSDTGLCEFPNAPDGTVCDDMNLCTNQDQCSAGMCNGQAVVCDAPEQCQAAGTCNEDTGQCVYDNAQDGTACDDGNAATQNDSCQNGLCLGENCTCTGVTPCCDGCFPINNGGACGEDGHSCTADVCDDGQCTHDIIPGNCFIQGTCVVDGVSNPDNECTYCDSTYATDAWRNKQSGLACDDGDACTQSDICDAGTCVGGQPVVCANPEQCKREGVCNPDTGVCEFADASNGTQCDDGDACTQSDSCFGGACTGSDPVVCTALDQCHEAGVCDSGTGLCSDPPKADDSPCDDADACTLSDTCQNGTCLAGLPKDCNDGNSCTDDTCNPASGQCVSTTVNNGTPCDDNDLCTVNDACQSGVCQSGSPVTCDDGEFCTNDYCDSGSGSCIYDALSDGVACDDGDDVCTINDACYQGACTGAPKDTDEDGYIDGACGGNDCVDDDNEVHPGHEEWCDGKDNNCLYGVDEGCATCIEETWEYVSYNDPATLYNLPANAMVINYYVVGPESVNLLAMEATFYQDSNGTGTGSFHAVVFNNDDGLPGDIVAQSPSQSVTTFYPDAQRFQFDQPVAFNNGEVFWLAIVYENDQTNSDSYVTVLLDDGMKTSDRNGVFYYPATPATDDPDEGWYSTDASWIMKPIGCGEGAELAYASHTDNVSGNYQANSDISFNVEFINVGFGNSLPATATMRLLEDDAAAFTLTDNTASVPAIGQGGRAFADDFFGLHINSGAAGQYYLILDIEDGSNSWTDYFTIFVQGEEVSCNSPYPDISGTFVNSGTANPMLFYWDLGDMFANPYVTSADFTLKQIDATFYAAASGTDTAPYRFRVYTHGTGQPGEVVYDSGSVTVQSSGTGTFTYSRTLTEPLTFRQGEVFWISIESRSDQNAGDVLVPIFDDALDPSFNASQVTQDGGDTWFSPWAQDASDNYIAPMLFVFPKGCEGTRLEYDSHVDNSGNGIDPGETVDLTVTIRNTGGVAVSNVQGILNVVGTSDVSVLDNQANFGTVPASGTKTATDPFRISVNAGATGRQYTLSLEIQDGTHNWTDSFTIVLNGGFVDLEVTTFDVTLAGSAPTYDITVTNVGNIDCVDEFRMDHYIDLEQAPAPNQTTSNWNGTQAGLAAGASYSFQLAYESVPQGTYTSYFQVDTTTLVSESDEGNNVAGPASFSLGGDTFVLLPTPVKFFPADMPVMYRVNPSGEETVPETGVSGDTSTEFEELDAGFQVWADATSGSLSFTNGGSTGNQGYQYDGQNTVSWNDPDNDLDSGVIAAAMPIWSSQTMVTSGTTFRRVVDSDIVFNDAINFCTYYYSGLPQCSNQIDIRGVATHEIGHIIGLDHPDVADATMYYATGPCNHAQYTLEPSDINGVQFIYP